MNKSTKKLLIVSNRLPVNVIRRGNLQFQPSSGGLATGLGSLHKKYNNRWIGWPGIPPRNQEEREIIIRKLDEKAMTPVFLSRQQIDNYYLGFSNRTIWPLFHYFPQYVKYNQAYWNSYRNVNVHFCDAVVEAAEKKDIIWVHDYQLMLLPAMIREKIPDVSIGFFLHIPFPSYELIRTLPWRRELISGILGADLIGFHTYDYVRHFISSVTRIIGLEHSLMKFYYNGRILRVDSFPMGIDYQKFENAVESSEVRAEIKKIKSQVGDRKIILTVDRLDYSKGIPLRLKAYLRLLEKHPKLREKITMIMVAVPSRSKVREYSHLKEEVDELVGFINGSFGTLGWMPIWYLYRSLPFPTLAALYSLADVCLVTPLRDGMNLVAKEYIASRKDGTGALILSEMAGAADEMREAIIINPSNLDEMTDAMEKFLHRKSDSMITSNRSLQKILRRYDVRRWAEDFLETLERTIARQQKVKAKHINKGIRNQIKSRYAESRRRLILLDYDGTLMPFSKNPQSVHPDDKLKTLIKDLNRDTRNEIVIVSGRDKRTLDNWLGGLHLGMVAEHGVWIKHSGKTWRMIEPLHNDWKKDIRPVLEQYTERTPGSFIEEKEYSLAWHFRRTDPDQGKIRANALQNHLVYMTANLNLQVLEGSRVLEVKNAGINKGRAAQSWLKVRNWDFILAVGDDWTDETLFEQLPEKAISIKVGYGNTQAVYTCRSYRDVREILNTLMRGIDEKIAE